jgi:hypothetical protein
VDAVQLSLALPSLQVAVCVQVVFPGPVDMVISAGQLTIDGTVLSRMVILKVQVAVLEAASVTVAVIVVVPVGKEVPEDWL